MLENTTKYSRSEYTLYTEKVKRQKASDYMSAKCKGILNI